MRKGTDATRAAVARARGSAKYSLRGAVSTGRGRLFVDSLSPQAVYSLSVGRPSPRAGMPSGPAAESHFRTSVRESLEGRKAPVRAMQYDYDLFISYAHIDDQSPFGEEKGWISLLHERLSVLLGQALGEEPRIWRDGHSLRGNDYLGGALDAGVTRSLLLVPVISPRYVQSEWCNREMEAFHAGQAQAHAPGSPGFRSRVFKVVKTPLPEHLRAREPAHIRSLIGYQFYGEDESSGVLTEFSPAPTDKQYWRTLHRLVSDIKQTLIELKHSPSARTAPGTDAPAHATPTPTAAPPTTTAPAAAPPPS